MNIYRSSKHRLWIRLITFTVITVMVCQEICWAEPCRSKVAALAAESIFEFIESNSDDKGEEALKEKKNKSDLLEFYLNRIVKNNFAFEPDDELRQSLKGFFEVKGDVPAERDRRILNVVLDGREAKLYFFKRPLPKIDPSIGIRNQKDLDLANKRRYWIEFDRPVWERAVMSHNKRDKRKNSVIIIEEGGVPKARYRSKVYRLKMEDGFNSNLSIIPEARILDYVRRKGIPGIVKAEHSLQLEDGRRMLLLEDLYDKYGGQNLLNYLKRKGRPGPAEDIDIILKLCRIIRTLHEHGIYHWDIKPQNVWITKTGDVILLDFGISFRSKEEFLNRRLQGIGTLEYISKRRYKLAERYLPEDVEEDFFVNSEIYSIARVLLEMFIRTRKWREKRDTPKRYINPYLKRLRRLDRIPKSIKDILERALRDGVCRYDNLDDFIRDLEQIKGSFSGQNTENEHAPQKSKDWATWEMTREEEEELVNPVIEEKFGKGEYSQIGAHQDELVNAKKYLEGHKNDIVRPLKKGAGKLIEEMKRAFDASKERSNDLRAILDSQGISPEDKIEMIFDLIISRMGEVDVYVLKGLIVIARRDASHYSVIHSGFSRNSIYLAEGAWNTIKDNPQQLAAALAHEVSDLLFNEHNVLSGKLERIIMNNHNGLRKVFGKLIETAGNVRDMVECASAPAPACPSDILEWAICWTLDLLKRKGIEDNNQLILKTVEYFTKIRMHNIYSSLIYAWAPAAIYLCPGAEVKIKKQEEVVDTVKDIAILSRGGVEPTTGIGMGLNRILLRGGTIAEMDRDGVIALIRRMIENGENFIFGREGRRSIYYVYKEGENVYELTIVHNGYILNLLKLDPYRTALAGIAGFSLAEADKIALIINQEESLYLPQGIDRSKFKGINMVMRANRKSYPVEIFFNNETRDIYIFDIASGDVVIIDRKGEYKDFIRKIDIAVFFADPDYTRISEKILKNYVPITGLESWEEKGRTLKPQVAALKEVYDTKTILALLSWMEGYIRKGVLGEDISECVLEEYIVSQVEEGKDASPGAPHAPVRFYHLRDKGTVVLNEGVARDDCKLGFRAIRAKSSWQGVADKEILDILGETLKNYQMVERESGIGVIYIYLKEDMFYLAIVKNRGVIRFSKVRYHNLGLYFWGICDYKSSFILSDILNGHIVLDIPPGQEAACFLIRGMDSTGKRIERKIYSEERTKRLHIVDCAKNSCAIIDLAGNFLEYREVAGEYYGNDYLDVTHAVLKPPKEQGSGNEAHSLFAILAIPSAILGMLGFVFAQLWTEHGGWWRFRNEVMEYIRFWFRGLFISIRKIIYGSALGGIAQCRSRLSQLMQELWQLIRQTYYDSFLSGQSDNNIPRENRIVIAIIKTILRILVWILPQKPPINPAIRRAWVRVKNVLLTASNLLLVQKTFFILQNIISRIIVPVKAIFKIPRWVVYILLILLIACGGFAKSVQTESPQPKPPPAVTQAFDVDEFVERVTDRRRISKEDFEQLQTWEFVPKDVSYSDFIQVSLSESQRKGFKRLVRLLLQADYNDAVFLLSNIDYILVLNGIEAYGRKVGKSGVIINNYCFERGVNFEGEDINPDSLSLLFVLIHEVWHILDYEGLYEDGREEKTYDGSIRLLRRLRESIHWTSGLRSEEQAFCSEPYWIDRLSSMAKGGKIPQGLLIWLEYEFKRKEFICRHIRDFEYDGMVADWKLHPERWSGTQLYDVGFLELNSYLEKRLNISGNRIEYLSIEYWGGLEYKVRYRVDKGKVEEILVTVPEIRAKIPGGRWPWLKDLLAKYSLPVCLQVPIEQVFIGLGYVLFFNGFYFSALLILPLYVLLHFWKLNETGGIPSMRDIFIISFINLIFFAWTVFMVGIGIGIPFILGTIALVVTTIIHDRYNRWMDKKEKTEIHPKGKEIESLGIKVIGWKAAPVEYLEDMLYILKNLPEKYRKEIKIIQLVPWYRSLSFWLGQAGHVDVKKGKVVVGIMPIRSDFRWVLVRELGYLIMHWDKTMSNQIADHSWTKGNFLDYRKPWQSLSIYSLIGRSADVATGFAAALLFPGLKDTRFGEKYSPFTQSLLQIELSEGVRKFPMRSFLLVSLLGHLVVFICLSAPKLFFVLSLLCGYVTLITLINRPIFLCLFTNFGKWIDILANRLNDTGRRFVRLTTYIVSRTLYELPRLLIVTISLLLISYRTDIMDDLLGDEKSKGEPVDEYAIEFIDLPGKPAIPGEEEKMHKISSTQEPQIQGNEAAEGTTKELFGSTPGNVQRGGKVMRWRGNYTYFSYDSEIIADYDEVIADNIHFNLEGYQTVLSLVPLKNWDYPLNIKPFKEFIIHIKDIEPGNVRIQIHGIGPTADDDTDLEFEINGGPQDIHIPTSIIESRKIMGISFILTPAGDKLYEKHPFHRPLNIQSIEVVPKEKPPAKIPGGRWPWLRDLLAKHSLPAWLQVPIEQAFIGLGYILYYSGFHILSWFIVPLFIGLHYVWRKGETPSIRDILIVSSINLIGFALSLAGNIELGLIMFISSSIGHYGYNEWVNLNKLGVRIRRSKDGSGLIGKYRPVSELTDMGKIEPQDYGELDIIKMPDVQFNPGKRGFDINGVDVGDYLEHGFVLPEWVKAASVAITSLRHMREKDPENEGHLGTFTDLVWDIREKHRLGFNALLLLPLTMPIDSSPYAQMSPYALNPEHIDWEKIEGGPKNPPINVAEASDAIEKINRNAEFNAWLMEQEVKGVLKDFIEYAELKAARSMFSSTIITLDEIRRIKGNDLFKGLVRFALYEQFVAQKQLKEALNIASSLGINILFDQPFFPCAKGTVTVFHPEMISDMSLYAGWPHGQPQQHWYDLAMWNYEESGALEFITRPIDYWVDFGFSGFRWNAVHFGNYELWKLLRDRLQGKSVFPLGEQLGGTFETGDMLMKLGYVLYAGTEFSCSTPAELEDTFVWSSGIPWFVTSDTHDSQRMYFMFKHYFGAGLGENPEPVLVNKAMLMEHAFCSSIFCMMSGSEFGDTKRINTPGVKHNWKGPSPHAESVRKGDLSDFVVKLNRLRHTHPAMQEYGNLVRLDNYPGNRFSDGGGISSMARVHKDGSLIMVNNLSGFEQKGVKVYVPFSDFGIDPSLPIKVEGILTGSVKKYIFASGENYLTFDLEPGEGVILEVKQEPPHPSLSPLGRGVGVREFASFVALVNETMRWGSDVLAAVPSLKDSYVYSVAEDSRDVRLKIATNLKTNSGMGGAEIIFSLAFVRDLLNYCKDYPVWANAVLFQRIFHEFGHVDGRRGESELIERDIQLIELYERTGIQEEVSSGFKALKRKLSFRSGYYYNLLNAFASIKDRDERRRTIGQYLEKLERRFIEQRILSLYHEDIWWVREHAKRVARIAEIIAERMQLGTELIRLIRIAALAHDVGKGCTREMIDAVKSPGPIIREIIDKHRAESVRMIKEAGVEVNDILEQVISYHHNPWETKGEFARIATEIIYLADQIDASQDAKRPYPIKMPSIRALNLEFRREYKWLHQVSKPVYKAFHKVLREGQPDFMDVIHEARSELQVFSLGRNSLLTGGETGDVNVIQKDNIRKTLQNILPKIKYGGIITHGNGPEVGVLLERRLGRPPGQPGDEKYLADVVEETQHWIGNDIKDVLKEMGISEDRIEVVITEVAVDPNDPGFSSPTKPIGIKPVKIIQIEKIKRALSEGKIVICVGGGGIPVNVNNPCQRLPAVIDKDLATALLVKELHERGPPVKRVVISTAEPCACLNYGKPNQTPIHLATVEEMKQYIREGHFEKGKMLPKIQAAIDIVESGSADEVIITSPDFIERLGEEGVGTRIVKSVVEVLQIRKDSLRIGLLTGKLKPKEFVKEVMKILRPAGRDWTVPPDVARHEVPKQSPTIRTRLFRFLWSLAITFRRIFQRSQILMPAGRDWTVPPDIALPEGEYRLGHLLLRDMTGSNHLDNLIMLRRRADTELLERTVRDKTVRGKITEALEAFWAMPEIMDWTSHEVLEVDLAIIRMVCEDTDPDSRAKKDMRQFVFGLFDRSAELVSKTADSIEVALRLAVIGNALDLSDTNIRRAIDEEGEGFLPGIIATELARDDFWQRNDVSEFKRKIGGEPGNILYVFDNAGEDVLDFILINELLKKGHTVTLAGKSIAASNDTTADDLRALIADPRIRALLGERINNVRVVATGSITTDTNLGRVSNEFRKAWNEAALVLFKGQGNYYTVRDYSPTKDCFFALRVKWPPEVNNRYKKDANVAEMVQGSGQAGLNALVAQISRILREQGNEKADELAEPIAREIYHYSAMISQITKKREVMPSNRKIKEGQQDEEEFMVALPEFFRIVNRRLFQNVIFEKDVTQEDIENFLLSLLLLGDKEFSDDARFRYLPERQVIISKRNGQYIILLRSKENVEKENERVTPEMRSNLERSLRLIRYALKRIGGGGIFALTNSYVELIKQLSEAERERLLKLFYSNGIKDIYDEINFYTDPEQQSQSFEDDILIERINGWIGAIFEIADLYITVYRDVVKEIGDRTLDKDDTESLKHMKENADLALNLTKMLRGQKIEDKEFMDISSYPDRFSKLYRVENFHISVTQGARLWLNQFLLENILLNAYRYAGDSDLGSFDVAVSEEGGWTNFHISYKGHIDQEKPFQEKGQAGLLLCDLVEAASGKITARNVGENVEIDIRFPLPAEPPAPRGENEGEEELQLDSKRKAVCEKLREVLSPIIGDVDFSGFNDGELVVALTCIFDNSQIEWKFLHSLGEDRQRLLIPIVVKLIKKDEELQDMRRNEELIQLASDYFALYFYLRFHKDFVMKLDEEDIEKRHGIITRTALKAPVRIAKSFMLEAERGEITLDLGTGLPGIQIISESEQDEKIWLVDNNLFMVRVLERYAELTGRNNLRVINDDVTVLSKIPDASVSAVISEYVLQYDGENETRFGREGVDAILGQIKRVLKDGGSFRIAYVQAPADRKRFDKVIKELELRRLESDMLGNLPFSDRLGRIREGLELSEFTREKAKSFDVSSNGICRLLEAFGFKISEVNHSFLSSSKNIVTMIEGQKRKEDEPIEQEDAYPDTIEKYEDRLRKVVGKGVKELREMGGGETLEDRVIWTGLISRRAKKSSDPGSWGRFTDENTFSLISVGNKPIIEMSWRWQSDELGDLPFAAAKDAVTNMLLRDNGKMLAGHLERILKREVNMKEEVEYIWIDKFQEGGSAGVFRVEVHFKKGEPVKFGIICAKNDRKQGKFVEDDERNLRRIRDLYEQFSAEYGCALPHETPKVYEGGFGDCVTSGEKHSLYMFLVEWLDNTYEASPVLELNGDLVYRGLYRSLDIKKWDLETSRMIRARAIMIAATIFELTKGGVPRIDCMSGDVVVGVNGSEEVDSVYLITVPYFCNDESLLNTQDERRREITRWIRELEKEHNLKNAELDDKYLLLILYLLNASGEVSIVDDHGDDIKRQHISWNDFPEQKIVFMGIAKALIRMYGKEEGIRRATSIFSKFNEKVPDVGEFAMWYLEDMKREYGLEEKPDEAGSSLDTSA